VKAAVFGAGSLGTAFSIVLSDSGTTPTLCARTSEAAERINAERANADYLPGVPLPSDVTATADPEEAVAGADVVVLAVPSQSLRDNLTTWAPILPRDAVVVSLMKGVELGTTKRMSEVIQEVTDLPGRQVVVVSGPNLAKEIAAKQPAASVVACVDPDRARAMQVACHSGYFRPYTNVDVIGCELGGAVKNVIALAVGMAAGMGFGDNARASLITRGLTETARLGIALGADPLTFAGLAGLGDLVVTCSSPLSRNRTFGENLGKGMSVEEVVAITRQTAEGVKSCRPILELAQRHGVDMPITEQVVRVVHDGVRPQEVLEALTARDAGHEHEGLR
jgi:glycerol-3-phosphate dehydrogenase (NAD(P)+)